MFKFISVRKLVIQVESETFSSLVSCNLMLHTELYQREIEASSRAVHLHSAGSYSG